LRKDKAKVYSVEPFTIQLKRKIDNPVGEFKVGIDDGAKKVGISVAYEDKIVFAGNIELRQDVHRKMLQRQQYRRTRRSRKLRHREPRFLNRGKKGWLPPTIMQKKESILRVLDDLKKRLNITNCVVEQGQFDVSSMSAGYKLTGREYQLSEYEGNNWRQKVLWRDSYKCQHCSSSDRLQAHHIQGRSKGGTNRVSNGITLCEKCHKDLHDGKWKLDRKPRHFKYPAHLQQGKWWLFGELKKRFEGVKVFYGWMTAKARRELNLEKDHYHDASAMIGANKYRCKVYSIKPKRTKVWEENPTKTCTERNGFKHYDLVKAEHRTRGTIVGSVRSLKKGGMTLRTSFDNNFLVSYRKAKLVCRPDRLIYCQV
jgi:N6-L-threonylcarbamoyladenine synthase